jgi:ribonucleoside-diphosphate reductase alpha chain
MSLAPERLSIGIKRHFTTPGVHPYDQVVWERRDARISNWKDGTVAFEQLGVEFPASWSLNATNIVAQKYFRGTLGTPFTPMLNHTGLLNASPTTTRPARSPTS